MAKKLVIAGLYLLLLSCILVIRYRSGSHFPPVAVRIEGLTGNAADAAVVSVVSPFGNSRVLSRDPHNPRLYRSKAFVHGPLMAVSISGVSWQVLQSASVNAVIGSSKIGFGSTIPLALLRNSEVDNDRSGNMTVRFISPVSTASLLRIARSSFNWQGDFWFLMVCCAQSGLVCALLSTVLRLYVNCSGVLRNASIVEKTLALILLVFLVLEFYFCSKQFLGSGDVAETLIACMLLGGLLSLVYVAGSYRVVGFVESKGDLSLVLVIVLATCVLRVFVSVGVSEFQSGDYATYWSMAGLMAEGRWTEVNNGWSGAEMMGIRAFLYAYPIRQIFGDSVRGLWWVNSSVMIGAAVVIYFTVRMGFGKVGSSISSVLFSLHPDVLFGGHLCRHETPALLYLCLLFLVFAGLLLRCCVERQSSVGYVQSVCLAVVCGLISGLLEGQRSYMPFLIASFMICFGGMIVSGFGRLMREPKAVYSLFGVIMWPMLMLAVTVSSAMVVNRVVTNVVRQKIGTFDNTYRNWHMLVSMETESEQTFADFVPFAALYAPAIPSQRVGDFFIRKIAFEKFASGLRFWGGAVKKVSWLSGTESAIRASGSAVKDEVFPSRFYVPFVTLRSAWGTGFYCLLLCCGIVRLLLLPALKWNVVEVFPLVFSCVVTTCLVLLAEAGEQYDIFLAIPLAFSGGILIGRLGARNDVGGDDKQSCGWLAPSARYFLAGLCVPVLVVGAQGISAMFLSGKSHLTFAGPASIIVDEFGIADVSRGAICLRTDRVGFLKKGAVVRCVFSVPAASFSADSIRCFVSADQRRRRIYTFDDAVVAPLRFEVRINGVAVASGDMRSLDSPGWIEVESDGGNDINVVEMSVEALEDFNGSDFTDPPRLAVEYLH